MYTRLTSRQLELMRPMAYVLMYYSRYFHIHFLSPHSRVYTSSRRTDKMALTDYAPVFEGKVATVNFLFSITSLLVVENSGLHYLIVGAIELTYMAVLALFWSYPTVKVLICSHGIGVVFSAGVWLMVSHGNLANLGFYLAALAFFHISEYVLTAIFNSHTLSVDSFLINHSLEYGIAAVASWIEFGLEFYFLPEMKSNSFMSLLSWIGIVLVIFGETMRKLAMFTAASNFTHIVQYRKRDTHSLVTHGVYSIFRHPSYVGWFYWSIGTQLVLANPVCLVGYAVASWRFFSERIYEEERLLVQFFREDYVQYKKQVGTGIPFNTGYPIAAAQQFIRLYQR